MKSQTKFIGVDIGNTNTVVSVFDENTKTAKSISLDGLSLGRKKAFAYGYPDTVIPTAICKDEKGAYYFGNTALLKLEESPNTNIIYRDFKKDILYHNNKNSITLLKLFVEKILTEIHVLFGGDLKIALSEPVDSSAVDGTLYQTIMKKIVDKVQEKLRFTHRPMLVKEPVATAVGYNVCRQQEGGLIFVFDFGGCTLNTIIFVTAPGNDRVIASQSSWIGGKTIDMYLARYINKEFLDEKINIDANDSQFQTLLKECERAKITLSKEGFFTFEFNDKQISIDKTDFDFHVLKPYGIFDDIRKAVSMTIDVAKVTKGRDKKEINNVVLTGGSSLIPSIKELLALELFDEPRIKSFYPFEAVSIGSAILASGRRTIKELRYDYFIYSYNTELRKKQAFKLFSKGQEYPSEKILFDMLPAYSKITKETQERIELRFYFKPSSNTHNLYIADNRKKSQIERYHDFNNDYYDLKLNYPSFVIYAPHSKELVAEYYCDYEGALRLTIRDAHSRQYAKLLDENTSEVIQDINNLRVAELD